MKRPLTSILFLLALAPVVHAQVTLKTQEWTEKPAIHTVDAKYAKESAVILSNTRRIQYVDESNQAMAEYYTLHRLVHINDDRGIERYNKIYLGVAENSDMIDVRARTVLPNGKVFELNKNNIKEIKEQDGNTYKIFALEGLEKGCEVEYTYTFKKPVAFMGREIVQSDIPELSTTFELMAPDRLRFELKPYNFTAAASDTVANGVKTMRIVVKDSPGMDEEKYADYAANLKRIEFRLSYNDSGNKGERLFTWNELARRLYGSYAEISDKENASVASLIRENGWDKLPDEKAKILAVEALVKTRYNYDEDIQAEERNTVESVLRNKIGGTIGTLRLYTAIFQGLGVGFQYVLAADRTANLVDRSFENWNNCDFSLFYFPGQNKFIAPTRPDLRYPWVAPNWTGANGLFFRKTTLGNVSTAIADVRMIQPEDYSKSFNNIEARLELSPDLNAVNVDCKLMMNGYTAYPYRGAFNFANEEDKKGFIKELAKNVAGTDKLISSQLSNVEFEKSSSGEPLVLAVKTKSEEFLEKAGNKLLVKIGMAIGQQVEMYQDKPRQSPVNIEYAHVLERKIDLVIPAGYKVSNLDDLKINQTHSDNGELTMGFVSDYSVKGNLLSVHVMEEYRKTFYPLSQFEPFKKIINASADFNKVVLVLEKI